MTSRREFLALAASLAAGVEVPHGTPSGPARNQSQAPTIRSRRNAQMNSGGRVDQTNFSLSHLALRWTGPAAPSIRLRTATGWSAWRDVRGCGAGKDGVSQNIHGCLLSATGGAGYEIVADGHLSDLIVDELDTRGDPARQFAAVPQRSMHIRQKAAPMPYLSRAAWDADESVRFDSTGAEIWPTAFFPVQTLTVHHTATANEDPDPAATIRAILYYDAITLGWGDIGYHLIIDEMGRVYEGRWSGSDPTPVYGPQQDGAGHPEMVNGAHVLGYNAGNIGIALLGDLTDRQPTHKARRSLIAVLAMLSALGSRDPLGMTSYVNPISGATHFGNTISGHRDWLPTECPGNAFYPTSPRYEWTSPRCSDSSLMDISARTGSGER